MSSRMTSVSGVYPYCNWDLNKWQNDFRGDCTVENQTSGVRARKASVFGAYLNFKLIVESE